MNASYIVRIYIYTSRYVVCRRVMKFSVRQAELCRYHGYHDYRRLTRGRGRRRDAAGDPVQRFSDVRKRKNGFNPTARVVVTVFRRLV